MPTHRGKRSLIGRHFGVCAKIGAHTIINWRTHNNVRPIAISHKRRRIAGYAYARLFYTAIKVWFFHSEHLTARSDIENRRKCGEATVASHISALNT